MKITPARLSLISAALLGPALLLAPSVSRAASAGLVTLHEFGACHAALPSGPVQPEKHLACNDVIDSANFNTDGAYPLVTLTVTSDGRLFGLTNAGVSDGTCGGVPPNSFCYPPYDSGSVFSITSGGQFTSLYTEYPPMLGSLLAGADGALYGSDGEEFFRLTTTGQYSPVAGTTYGDSLGAPAQGSDGTFYAADYATTYGPQPDSQGALFSVSTTGVVTTLHTFTALSGSVNSDGANPAGGPILGSDGNLYGTTTEGGAAGFGTIYQSTTAGQLTTLHSFISSTDGAQSLGSLLLGKDGNLYGTTYTGGSYGDGTVFKISTGGTFTVLHAFKYTDGANPRSGLVQASNGAFYGATSNGGANGSGTIFEMNSKGTVTTLYSFSSLLSSRNSDGAVPNGVVFGADSNLYGTAEIGGSNGTGTVFQLITQRPTMTLKLSPTRVAPLQNASLIWSSTSATSCAASGAWSGSEPTGGSINATQSVAGTYSYKLTCSGPAGSVSKTAKLTVT